MLEKEKETCGNFIDELITRLVGQKEESPAEQKIEEFLGCPKSEQVIAEKAVPHYLAGLYSIGIEELISQHEYFVKNYMHGEEKPPIFIDWKTGYNEQRSCLLDGFYFVKAEHPFVVMLERRMFDFGINIISSAGKKDLSLAFLKKLDDWTKKNNFYKNKMIEARDSHYGIFFNFLPPIDKDWNNVVLSKMQVDEISENILVPIEYPDTLRKLNRISTRSVLFVGKPGNGKTLTLKILSEQIKNYTKIWVSSTVLSGFEAVPQLFNVARSLKPSILILEDFDLIGQRREDGRNITLGNLLMELDGQKMNDRLIILITSNNPEIIDSALIRPGRIDRIIDFPSPTEPQRRSLLRMFLKGHSSDINVGELARKTEGNTGASLKELVTLAILRAIKRDPKNPKVMDYDFKLE